MTDIDPGRTFRGLPLTPEQDAEVRHYIKVRKQHGEPWNTPELEAMLRDMLEPPGDEDADENVASGGQGVAELLMRCGPAAPQRAAAFAVGGGREFELVIPRSVGAAPSPSRA